MIESMFDRSPVGFFSFFDDGTLHLVNETLCSLLGYQKKELAGVNVERLFTLPTRIFYQTHLFPLVKMQSHAEEIFVTLLAKDKQHLPVLLNAKRFEEQAGSFTACSFIVVANRKKFEDELVAARKAAETALKENSELAKAKAELQRHAEQLDDQLHTINKQNYELRQLNHVITHGLKEPLRKILVYSEMLHIQESPGKKIKNIQKLNKATSQMRTVVSGIQQYVWLDENPTRFSEVRMPDLIKKVEESLQNEFGDLLLLRSNQLPLIKADPQQLHLLFYHILSNAIKFRKEKKALVSITASLTQQNRFRSDGHKYKYEDFVKIEIRDEGVGFDPLFKEEVFGLFNKFHVSEGVGLGLALCRKIADNHNGVIKADSRVNGATTITVELPLNQH